MIAYHWIVNTS